MAKPSDDQPRPYESSPCGLHEADPASSETASEDPLVRAGVMRWRKAERRRLIEERFELESGQRRAFGERIAAHLEKLLGDVHGATVSAYWPFKGEPDLRSFLERITARGGRTALPVVAQKRAPLAFRSWEPGEPLDRGVWNIPVPAAGQDVVPDVIIAAVVGFDSAGYRLGYGGGYYDRTLAAMTNEPRVYGVGYSRAAVSTIYPQWHDIPMHGMVTENGVLLVDS